MLALLLADHSRADFINAFARYSNHPGAYTDVIGAAKSSGVVFGASIGAMIATIPFMVVNYNGVLYSYYVGGELRRPARTYLYASAISIGVLVVVWVGVWALLRHTAGLHFMQAQANLGNSNPTAYGKITSLQSSAGGLGYGLALSGDPISKILLATTIPLAAVAVNIAFLACTTRVLFALAFDRLLPVRVAQVVERNHAPTTAIVIVLIVSILFCLLLAFVNISNIVALEALFFALILLAGGIAATFLRAPPSRAHHARGTERRRPLAGVPVVTWIGSATTALALFTVIEVIAHQSAYGKFSFESVAALVIVLVAGPVIYTIARGMRQAAEFARPEHGDARAATRVADVRRQEGAQAARTRGSTSPPTSTARSAAFASSSPPRGSTRPTRSCSAATSPARGWFRSSRRTARCSATVRGEPVTLPASEQERLYAEINRVGFYPVQMEPDEITELEDDPRP